MCSRLWWIALLAVVLAHTLPYPWGTQDVKACDVDGDTLTDLVVAPASGSWVTVFVNTGQGGFTECSFVSSSGPDRCIAADLDGDLRPELIAVSHGHDSIEIFTSRSPCFSLVGGDVNGSGSLNVSDAIAIVRHLFLGQAIACPEAADTNQDGRLDTAGAVALLGALYGGTPLSCAPVTCPADGAR